MAIAPGNSSLTPRQQFARALRERFLAEAGQAMSEIGVAVLDQITTLMDAPSNARESQERRDVWMAYKKCRPIWLEGTMKVWRECLDPPTRKKQADPEVMGLQLVGTEVVENKILASRMVMAVMEKVNSQLEDLRLRMQFLEGTEDLALNDLFRPEVLVLLMVEQWANSGMPGDSWAMVNDVVQKLLIERLKAAYASANDVLIKKGVMPTIELKDRVKAPPRAAPTRGRPPAPAGGPQQSPEGRNTASGDLGRAGGGDAHSQGGYPQGNSGHVGYAPGPSQQGGNGQNGGAGNGEAGGATGPQGSGGGFFGGRLGWGAKAPAQSGAQSERPSGPNPTTSSPTPFWKQSSGI